MSTTKFKYLDEKLGLGATKSFFPFYDNEKDKDFKVRLDVLVDLIAGQVTSVGKSVFELSGITNSGNNYSSSYTLASYITEGIYIFQPNVNSSGNAFLNVSSLGSLPIKKFDGTSLINVDDLKSVNTYLLLNKTTYWLLAGGLAGGTTTSLQDAYNIGRYVNVVAGEPIELSGDDNLKGRNSGLGYNWELKGNGDFSTKGVINEYSSSTSLLAGYATNINATNVVYVTGSGITVNGFQGCITFLTSPASHTGSKRTVIFDGVNTLVNGSGFYLLTGANITTASGDKAVFISTFANGWEMVDYVRYDGTALSGGSLTQASQSQVEAAFDNTDQTTPVVLEQTSALTPFNAWWLVQKIKAFFSTTANQTDSTNKRFVTDAEKVVIGNTSNTNTGDETAPRIGALLTPDTSPLDTDSVVSWDGTLLMKTTWLNIKAFLVTYFDTLYLKLNGGTLTGALNYAPSVIPTSSATPAIGAAASNNITITSTTTITGFDTIAEGSIRRVKFAAITPLTHSANLDLPTSANITTSIGDEAVFRSNGGGSWKCISYVRKDGSSLSTTYVDTQDKKFNFKLSFNNGRVIEDYWTDGGTVSVANLSSGITLLEHSIDAESSYQTTYPFVITAGTRVFWRCTYATNTFTGSANLKGSFTNTI